MTSGIYWLNHDFKIKGEDANKYCVHLKLPVSKLWAHNIPIGLKLMGEAQDSSGLAYILKFSSLHHPLTSSSLPCIRLLRWEFEAA